ncbi:hypothetical protein B0O79_2651 [Flavobacteriaceae bacterium MAR_2009_75]|nr:hypothetical protein B0O79_2651 [Flavobacteriaceae bacterium MAR_2009_75]
MKSSMIALFLSIGLISCTPEELKEFLNKHHPTEETDEEEPESIDPGLNLVANDLEDHPMQEIAKPEYLQTITDPSFGTTIRRITDAGDGNIVKPMYSTIQAWNADESYMILYDQTNGVHQLLDGMNYSFIRNLDDIRPDDIEQIFWDFENPDILFYIDRGTAELIRYSVGSQEKEILANLKELTDCADNIGSGNDVQMMSWDSDVIGFRCDNTAAYYYRISTAEVVQFDLDDVSYTAPMPAPSGERFYHRVNIYSEDGAFEKKLNEKSTQHSSLGSLADGTDAHFAVAFEEGPEGGCFGNIIAHNLVTGDCISVISEDLGYPYSKSGTHISAVAHKNPGWIAASMIGFEKDGQTLLDQELVLARVEAGNVDVYRIGHHRSDEDEEAFDYWGEPHAVISPTGTRVLFGSDWSGEEDGKSIESYVVELPAFEIQNN